MSVPMKTRLSWVVILLLGACGPSARLGASARPNPVTVVLPQLVETISQRLALADKVALSKWDAKRPVEDTQREQAVLGSVAAQARAYKLDPERAKRFFADQIEANKLIQYGLLWDWALVGRAPSDPRLDLAKDIRPQLDRLQATLLEQISRFEAYREDQRCVQWVSSAVAHRAPDDLHQWALVRATGGLCDRP